MGFNKEFINILFLLFGTLQISYALSADFIQASGPGMDINIVLPVRYFFLRSNNSEPINEKDLNVHIYGITINNTPCRLWSQVLNRNDGTFIVRYKIYETCAVLTYNVTYRSSPIQSFPYIFGGPVYPEECDCPQENFQKWLSEFGCSDVPQQIHDDLSKYPSVNFDNIYEEAVRRFNNSFSSSVCHYVVKSNKVYRTCYGQHIDFKMFMDAMLLALTRKVVLPDLEFYSNLGDWPLMSKDNPKSFPLFSWCGSEDTDDIVIPTYDLTESTLNAMGRVSLDMLSVQGNIETKWEQKINKAFWRGRDSDKRRLKLIDLSREHPDLINASLTNFFFYPNEEKKYGPKEKHISFFKFFDYKYQLCLDGTVAAYRFPYLLAGDSLVFKQDSKYYEYFYSKAKRWEHYIPVKSDLSDLIELLRWAAEHEGKSREIARLGRQFANENVLPQHIFCYYGHLFNEWSKKLESHVVLRKGMEEVKQKYVHSCECFNDRKPKDEL